MKKSIKLLALIFVLCITVISCTQDTRGYKVKVGDKAPNIELVTPSGEKVMLNELKGKVVMLQFTATWCKVCIEEMPHIESDIWSNLKNNDDFALYGVMYKQGSKDVDRMRELTSVTYPLALDSDGTKFHEFAEEGSGVTRNIIVDQNGDIAFLTRLYNQEEFNSMKDKINELLKK